MNGEDGADGGVDVDVAGAIQRVELEHVLALRVLGRDGDRLRHLLGAHHTHVTALLHAAGDHVVGEDIELLHLFALNVLFAGEAENAGEARAAHLTGNDLGGQGDLMKQPREVAGRAGRLPLHRQNVLLEGLARERRTGGTDGEVLRRVHTAPLADPTGRAHAPKPANAPESTADSIG